MSMFMQSRFPRSGQVRRLIVILAVGMIAIAVVCSPQLVGRYWRYSLSARLDSVELPLCSKGEETFSVTNLLSPNLYRTYDCHDSTFGELRGLVRSWADKSGYTRTYPHQNYVSNSNGLLSVSEVYAKSNTMVFVDYGIAKLKDVVLTERILADDDDAVDVVRLQTN